MGDEPQETAERVSSPADAVDGTFRLVISDNRLMVYLDEITAPQNGGKAVTVEAVLNELKKQKLSQGVDSTKLENIITAFNAGTLTFASSSGNKLRKTAPRDDLCIVMGDEPIPGEDGCVQWAVDESCIKGNDCAVLPGELILIYRPATSGKEGKDVFGKKVSTKPGSNNFPRLGAGLTTTTTDQGEEYRAQCLGIVKYDENGGSVALSVEPTVAISEDAMEVLMDIPAKSVTGVSISCNDIVAALTASGVIYGIDEDAINNALSKAEESSTHKNRKSLSQVVVAKGTPVEDGKDARLVLSRDNKSTGMELAGGRIDFREKNYPWNVSAGDTVGYLLEARNAADGHLVTGEVIEAKQPKQIEIELDGLHKDERGRLIADKDGALIIGTTSLYIVELLEINGSIDQKSGNVHSDIPVHVKGYVEPGFKLESKKEIIIDNNIEDATVQSGGNILIKGGIRGTKSEVFAPGEVNVGFIENAKVFINGQLVVRGSIINSEIGSNGDIVVGDKGSKNASVIGGIVTAKRSVEAASLGSQIYAKTIVRVGFSQESRREFNKLEGDLAAKKAEMEQLDQIEYRHVHYPKDDSEVILAKVGATRDAKKQEMEAIMKAIEELKNTVTEAEQAKVIVHKCVYPGVTISINEYAYDVTREMGNGTFSLDTEIKAVIFTPASAASST